MSSLLLGGNADPNFADEAEKLYDQRLATGSCNSVLPAQDVCFCGGEQQLDVQRVAPEGLKLAYKLYWHLTDTLPCS